MKTAIIRPFPEWQIPDFDVDSKVICAFDVEYQSGVQKIIPIGGRDKMVQQRRLEDIISIQLAFNYQNREPVQCFVHRDPSDKPFIMYDLIKQLKAYLQGIKALDQLKQRNKTFTLELWTFWGGVDISAFNDYDKVLTEYAKDKAALDSGKLVTLHGNTVFTGRPLNLTVKNDQRQTYELVPKMRLTIRDMTKLAPGKSNLAKLGELVNLPKLDTEKWDVDDGYTKGYYKSHMTELWHNRPNDFIDYAMTDTVITALYGAFMLEMQRGLAREGLGTFKPVELKASLGAIAANTIIVKNKQPASWIIDRVILQLQAINGTEKDIESYLQTICKFRLLKEADSSKKYKDYDLNDLPPIDGKTALLQDWLREHLDFDRIRKGYYFVKADLTTDSAHKSMSDDLPNKIDMPMATLFDDANRAYYGGYNVVHYTGVIADGYKQDYDEKASYNTNGHLLPDIAPGLGNYSHKLQNVRASDFRHIVDEVNQKMNGAYTVGVGVFDITYPDDYKGFVITPKRVNDGPRYFRHIKEVTLAFTDAYAAWLCGAQVYTHRLSFPYQAKFDAVTMKGICNEGQIQDIFQQRREQCPKDSAEGLMDKNIGNQAYGSTGEGLKEKRSRDFNNGKPYYIPFSPITNPLKAMQYTALTRLHIVLLQKAIWKVDQEAVFLNNVTDGCLVCTREKLDVKDIEQALNGLPEVDERYRQVVKHHFHGVYIEEKDGSDTETANIRARLTFSRDDELKAMVGINIAVLKPHNVFEQFLDQGKNCIPVSTRMITGLVEMRHSSKFGHLQSSWDETTNLFLGYDFAQWPTEYRVNGDFVYWLTRPYRDEDEFASNQAFGRTLIKYGAWCSADYTSFFDKTLSEFTRGYKPKLFGEFVRVAKSNKNRKSAQEIYYNWARYVYRYGCDVNVSYQKICDLLTDHENYGESDWAIPSLGSFKKYVSRHLHTTNEMINYVLLHAIKLI